MAPRSRMPLTFGAGLDRSTGAGVRDPRSLYDGRNVVAAEARLDLRYGLSGSGLPAVDWGTDLVAQVSVEKSLHVLQVLYDRPTRELKVYVVNPINPATRQLVGSWGTLNASAEYPIVTHAEAGGIVYFAHAEEVLSYRLPTVKWKAGALDTDAGTLTVATADFDGSGAPGDIYFFGVCSHLSYIVGWGWGTEADATTKDRPELVRMTKPDDPEVWPPETYFLCGTKSTRVLGCWSMENGLSVHSALQTHVIFGTDPDTFGVDIADPTNGVVSPRAGFVAMGKLYTWASTGPRVRSTARGASQDLAMPLDLLQRQPASWPARGPLREAFAVFEPEQRAGYFAFPDLTAADAPSTLAYVLSARSEVERFTAAEFKRRLACAGRYITGKVPVPSGLGYADAMTFSDQGWVSGNNGRTLRVSWTNMSVVGSEQIEVWLRADSGTWSLSTTVATTLGAQTLDIIGKDSLTVYDVALRHKMPDGAYTAGYAGATPDDWTAVTAPDSKAQVTTGAATPSLNSTASFTRLGVSSVVFELGGSGADARCPLVLERKIGAGPWTEVVTFTGSTGPLAMQVDISASLYQSADYRLRHKKGVLTGAYSATQTFFHGLQVAGPTITLVLDVSVASPNNRALEFYYDVPAGYVSQLECVDTAETFLQPVLISTIGYQMVTSLTGAGSVQYRARLAKEAFGIYDYGPWTATAALAVNPAGSNPATPPVDFTTFYWDEDTASGGGNFNLNNSVPRFDDFLLFATPAVVAGTNMMVLIGYTDSQHDLVVLGAYTEITTAKGTGIAWPMSTARTFRYDTTTKRRSSIAVVSTR